MKIKRRSGNSPPVIRAHQDESSQAAPWVSSATALGADSTTYTRAIETAEESCKRLYLQAWNRGWSHAAMKIVIGGGAELIWNPAGLHFPGAVQIVDLYHARQHLWELARKLHPQ